MEILKKVKSIVQAEFKPDGFNFGSNEGTAGGQSVPHFHFHVIPRYKGDVKNPRGGIRNIFPEKADYFKDAEKHPAKKKYLG